MTQSTVFDPEHSLWYRREASHWEEALPIGNGRIGAMVFGGVTRERIVLNEDTLWSGYPKRGDNPGAAKAFRAARALTLRGEYHKAQEIIEQRLQGAETQFYLPLGDLLIDFELPQQPTSYTRSLSLRDAVCETAFACGRVNYKREAFVSALDQALYLRFTADQAGALFFSLQLASKLRHRCAADRSGLRMDGICPSGMADREHPTVYPQRDDRKGMRFSVCCDLQTDGSVRVAKGGRLSVSGASIAVLRLFTRTSFAGFDRHPFINGLDEQALCERDKKNAERDFTEALRRHVKDHHSLYERCGLHLEGKPSLLPTNERLESHLGGQLDDALYALLFHYGRYLMIASSREGTQAMNLQGIWNEHLCAPWRANYTLNINTEMNYWPAEICNLSECHKPLFALIRELCETGAKTAESVYGARGAAAHHNTDLWRLSNPVSRGMQGSAEWAFWPMSLGWLSTHMTEHAAYSLDKAFLKTQALPVLRACARFYLDFLTEEDSGTLIPAPATSPENTFYYRSQKTAVTKSAQMSVSIIRTVFSQYLSALEELEIEETMAAEVRSAIPRLPDYQFGPHGEMLEWDAPYEETDPHHRHLSPLFDLFPGDNITPERTPEAAKACERTLIRRGDEGTGWSLAWKVNLWARLTNGEKALALLRRQLRPVREGKPGGGSYPNLLDAHPPFQIDGNFGACAGIARMLMQSGHNTVHLLPALPKCWSGSIRGLCAIGGAEVDITFQQGELHSAHLRMNKNNPTLQCFYKGLPVDSVMIETTPDTKPARQS